MKEIDFLRTTKPFDDYISDLIYNTSLIKKPWQHWNEILHELNDKKINDAISDEPPSLSDKWCAICKKVSVALH